MRTIKLERMKKEIRDLKFKGITVEEALDLAEKMLIFTAELVQDMEKLNARTKLIEEYQEILESDNNTMTSTIINLASLSIDKPEEALEMLREIYNNKDFTPKNEPQH